MVSVKISVFDFTAETTIGQVTAWLATLTIAVVYAIVPVINLNAVPSSTRVWVFYS
jgi:hypothetical protein